MGSGVGETRARNGFALKKVQKHRGREWAQVNDLSGENGRRVTPSAPLEHLVEAQTVAAPISRDHE